MKLKHACAASVVLALAGMAGLTTQVEAQQSAGVAAVVNDEVISTLDLRARAMLILLSSGIRPTQETMSQVRGQALRGLVDEHLQLQEAHEKKITVDKADIDSSIENIAKRNNVSAQKFTEQLKASGAGIETLRSQVEAQIAWSRLMSSKYGGRVRVSTNEVQVALDRMKASVGKSQYNVAEILLPADNEKEFKDATIAAQSLLKQMAGGRVNFAAIARQFSSAPSAAAGGDLGWMSEEELRPELRDAVRNLKPGQVSAPIRMPTGIEIIALRDARQGDDQKSAMHVKLRQISAPTKSRSNLDKMRTRTRGCDGLARAVRDVPGGQLVDLGDTAESDLTESTRALVANTKIGQASSMFDTEQGPAFMVVCDRDTAEGALPSRNEVADQLYENEMALMSQRYLMDLRRESTIITR